MHCSFCKALNSFHVLAAFMALLCSAASAQIGVLTQHNDNSRSGVNLNETLLTTSNVNVKTFGKLFTAKVDGYIFAQPLYVPNLSIAGGTHNVVYVATAADSVFAFDADTGTLLWSRNYGTPVPSSVIQTENILVQVGIISTPVIDASTQTMYVVTKTYENIAQIFRLHALDITTGNEKFGGPVIISATANGTGDGNDGSGHVAFRASQENQRPAVTLANGVIYLAFASHEDITPFHGWVLGYSASTLSQLYVFNDTPNGNDGGIWQSGQGLVVDGNNNLYLMVGNGTADVQNGGSDYGEGFIKLSGSLTPLDYFIPNNFDTLNSRDEDVSSGGPVAIAGTTYIAGEGKQGLMYVVDMSNMGHYNASSNPIHQEFTAGPGLWGSPVFWNNPNSPTLYVWNRSDTLKAFSFSNGFFQTSPSAQSSTALPGGSRGGALAISSNHNAPGTNIVWASIALQDADHSQTDAQLFAFDATDVGRELWDTRQNDARDDLGSWAKFVAPTVANGKVYMATNSGLLAVYGLLGTSGGNPNATSVDDSVLGTGEDQFDYVGAWHHCTNCDANLYGQSNSWDNTANDDVTVAFTGNQVQFYGVQDTVHGIGAVSIDGGAESNIDFYAPARKGNVLLWTSPVLASGSHTFKLRVTGTHNPGSTDSFVAVDRIDIITGTTSAPSAPTGLTATAGNGQVFLSWTPSSGAASYSVYRGTSSGGEANAPIVSGVTATTYTDTNLANGTTYYYTVTATNSAGTSPGSNEANGAPRSGTGLANGIYTVTNEARTLVWDDPHFAKASGTKVVLWPWNGGTNQRWTFTSIGDGRYTIQNQNSGLVLADPHSSSISGTQLIQWPSNAGADQAWLVTSSANGYTITNESSGLLVDASDNAKGTDIQEATASGGSAQIWSIESPSPTSTPTIFRPSEGAWYSLSNSGIPVIQQWGLPNDVPVLADYDGDGQKDLAVWRPSQSNWHILPSRNASTPIIQQWGLPGDIPVPGDYDGDADTDFAVWRPSNGTWYVLPTTGGTAPVVQQWGLPGDTPVPGDFDGDGKADFAVWRPANGVWYIIPSSNPSTPIVQQWGLPGDIPVPGDYDGDGKTDFAVWRPANGVWYIIPSGNSGIPILQQWGLPGDIPVPGDYAGTGKTGLAVWRPSGGTWQIMATATTNPQAIQWGLPDDFPINSLPR
jgi:Ricin-type beta-trefoil lectin domain-like/Fibronectin type III domain/PQQ enzyme repeat